MRNDLPEWLRPVEVTIPKNSTLDGINVVSFSGGRTSAYLVYLMEQERQKGAEVHYVFMDTGAEHPATYEFIRNIVERWNIPLVCLRAVVNPQKGIGVKPRVVNVKDIGQDLVPWGEMLAKYGAPDAFHAHCTNRMKTIPYEKWCNEQFGRGKYTTWIGIRSDEPHRLKVKQGIRYLAELSDVTKQDILNWWASQPFDLQISEHLGNCVFCIKKTDGKLALATRDESEMFQTFVELTEGDETRRMYRGRKTLSEVSRLFPDYSRDELFTRLKMAQAFDTGTCTESCEVFKLGVD